MIRELLVATIVTASIALAGCDEGGDNPFVEGAQSASYYPMKATDATGSATAVYWTYRVNGGEPLEVPFPYGDVELRMRFGELRVEIDAAGTERRAELRGTVEGEVLGEPIAGNFFESIREDVLPDAAGTAISREDLRVQLDLSAAGDSGSAIVEVSAEFDPAVEWFLDREDLGLLPVGHIHRPLQGVQARVTGQIYLLDEEPLPISGLHPSPESWRIVGHQDRVEVLGVEYRDVVIVQRDAVATSRQGFGSGGSGSLRVTVTYWVARGIGMIRASGVISILGEPVEIELVDTNLSA